MNKNAHTTAELRAMRTEQTPTTQSELRDWIRTAAEITSLAILAAALALLIWAL